MTTLKDSVPSQVDETTEGTKVQAVDDTSVATSSVGVGGSSSQAKGSPSRSGGSSTTCHSADQETDQPNPGHQEEPFTLVTKRRYKSIEYWSVVVDLKLYGASPENSSWELRFDRRDLIQRNRDAIGTPQFRSDWKTKVIIPKIVNVIRAVGNNEDLPEDKIQEVVNALSEHTERGKCIQLMLPSTSSSQRRLIDGTTFANMVYELPDGKLGEDEINPAMVEIALAGPAARAFRQAVGRGDTVLPRDTQSLNRTGFDHGNDTLSSQATGSSAADAGIRDDAPLPPQKPTSDPKKSQETTTSVLEAKFASVGPVRGGSVSGQPSGPASSSSARLPVTVRRSNKSPITILKRPLPVSSKESGDVTTAEALSASTADDLGVSTTGELAAIAEEDAQARQQIQANHQDQTVDLSKDASDDTYSSDDDDDDNNEDISRRNLPIVQREDGPLRPSQTQRSRGSTASTATSSQDGMSPDKRQPVHPPREFFDRVRRGTAAFAGSVQARAHQAQHESREELIDDAAYAAARGLQSISLLGRSAGLFAARTASHLLTDRSSRVTPTPSTQSQPVPPQSNVPNPQVSGVPPTGPSHPSVPPTVQPQRKAKKKKSKIKVQTIPLDRNPDSYDGDSNTDHTSSAVPGSTAHPQASGIPSTVHQSAAAPSAAYPSSVPPSAYQYYPPPLGPPPAYETLRPPPTGPSGAFPGTYAGLPAFGAGHPPTPSTRVPTRPGMTTQAAGAGGGDDGSSSSDEEDPNRGRPTFGNSGFPFSHHGNGSGRGHGGPPPGPGGGPGGGGSGGGGGGPPGVGHSVSWDSYHRRTIPTTPAGIAAARARRGIHTQPGTNPDMLYLDPDQPITCDPETKTVLPWTVPNNLDGITIAFPVKQNVLHFDTELLQAYYTSGRMPNTVRFKKDFPQFGQNYSKDQYKTHLLQFIDNVCESGREHGVYVCPSQMHLEGDVYGYLFYQLPLSVQHTNMVQSGPALLQKLKAKETGLLAYPELSDELAGCTDGYQAMYRLAVMAGHPRLTGDHMQPSAPKQKKDEAFSAFFYRCCHYLKTLSYYGMIMSDRRFIRLLFENCHDSVRSWLRPFLREELMRGHLNEPLPSRLSPEFLLQKLRSEAQRDRVLSLITSPPSSNRTTSLNHLNAAIHRLTSYDAETSDSDSDVDDDGCPGLLAASSTSTDASDVDVLLCQLTNAIMSSKKNTGSNPRSCFLCGSEKHLVGDDCPKIKWLKENSYARRAVLRVLDKKLDTPANKEKKAAIRSLLCEDTEDFDVPGETNTPSSAEDFREAG